MALRELTDEVMYEIGQLSGYEYVDTYATKKAEDLPTDIAHIATFEDARQPVDRGVLIFSPAPSRGNVRRRVASRRGGGCVRPRPSRA